MILAYLHGPENHAEHDGNDENKENSRDFSDELLLKGSEAVLLVELLANTLHSRGKTGAGGYNATTFSVKKVLCAIRFLLTNKFNTKTLYVTSGIKLNVLLFKALSLHSIQDIVSVDAEAAEAACFSLYLLSNHGFMSPFLPEDRFPFYQMMHCYFEKESCTVAGRHAAKQLMLRSSYLNYEGSIYDDDEECNIQDSDMELEHALLHAAESIVVPNIMVGSKPLDDVFGRPLTRKKRKFESEKNGHGGNNHEVDCMTFNSGE